MRRLRLAMGSGIEIQVNGERRSVAAGATVSDLLVELELAEEKVAVELDHAILRRPLWSGTVLSPGSRVEIVHFVGGG